MLRLLAPAKLNLFLRILGRRPDGYHEIETVFERLDLADELAFEPQPRGIALSCSDPALSCGEDNLVMKAARLLQQAAETTAGARIHLTKRIPMAAGLGGGSSDAATTLVGLNQLWALGWPRERLEALAAQVGSDVAFFLTEAPFAIGRGRGERCEPLDLPRRRRGSLGANGEPVEPEPIEASVSLWHVLVVPAERLSTKDVYAGYDESRDGLTSPAPSITILQHALHNGSLSELAQGLWNDLEPEAIRRCPVISVIQSRLRSLGCPGVRLSGSGTAVFGLCADAAHAQDVADRLRRHPERWRIDIVRTGQSSVIAPANHEAL